VTTGGQLEYAYLSTFSEPCWNMEHGTWNMEVLSSSYSEGVEQPTFFFLQKRFHILNKNINIV
jgi:hypothetical protein